MTTPTLYCAETSCQGANPQNHLFCQHCNTPLLKRYLWVIGEGIHKYKIGELISDRYWLLYPQIVLDTKPAEIPHFPEDIPDFIDPYLRLFPYRLHIPQLFGQLPNPTDDIWLVEYGTPLNPDQFVQGRIFSSFTTAWPQAEGLRQLNWLWQMAKLWDPLQAVGVASSLTDPSLLGVNGSVIKILELQPDRTKVSLKDLGIFWSDSIKGASSLIQPWLKQLCQALATDKIQSAQVLVSLLDDAIAHISTTRERTYEVCAQTDTGTLRHHNEDACYPNNGDCMNFLPGENALAIVCDGIGGHDGGEIASGLAIDELTETVKTFSQSDEELTPQAITHTLEQAILSANDRISERNDSEQRTQRQRMGTTLVMTVSQKHQMYLAHVGDSRIYWIHRHGCHQVTLDDDVASREVRLGYALYRDAISFPSSGALVQALGMNSSSRLYPTVERVTLDEDCVFLLCSDGLSDNDRVEQYWESEILPILTQGRGVSQAVERLMAIANEKNGHDNITVALVHCRVTAKNDATLDPLPLPQLEDLSTPPPPTEIPTQLPPESSTQKPNQSRLIIYTVLILLGLLAGILVLSYSLFPEMRHQTNRLLGNTTVTSPETQEEDTETPDDEEPTEERENEPPTLATLKVGDVIQIEDAIALHIDPDPESPNTVEISAQTPLKVTQKQENDTEENWLQLQQCTPPTPSPEATETPSPSPTESPTTPREESQPPTGWLQVQNPASVPFSLVSGECE